MFTKFNPSRWIYCFSRKAMLNLRISKCAGDSLQMLVSNNFRAPFKSSFRSADNLTWRNSNFTSSPVLSANSNYFIAADSLPKASLYFNFPGS